MKHVSSATLSFWIFNNFCCGYFIWYVSCTVVVLTCFLMCGWVYVGVFWQLYGCFGNMCTCFLLFVLCFGIVSFTDIYTCLFCLY
jgi:hypothetical protein